MVHPRFILLPFVFLLSFIIPRAASAGGRWDLLLSNIGISAMHVQFLHTDRVIIFDLTNFGASNISLPAGRSCRTNDRVLNSDCTAHSVEYDVASNTVRPLTILTNTLCSSGAVLPDGTLAQTGGTDEGGCVARLYHPCTNNSCDWDETTAAAAGNSLVQPRWYATNQKLPDGRQIVVGGLGQFNFEYYPKTSATGGSFNLPFLSQTDDPGITNNLYPYIFLNVDGNLFIFANNRAILFDFTNNKVVKTYPTLSNGDPRNYPSSGSAVLLPLKNIESGSNITAEVFVCGGAPKGAYKSAQNSTYMTALNTCGRIRITDTNPEWALQTMPAARVLGDMVLLPNGEVLIINGAGSGTAGAGEMARDPVFTPVIYKPESSVFEVQNPNSIPRMYHSSAVLLRDGRVLVGGSNPHVAYRFTGTNFPTDLSLESFSPSYLEPELARLRPRIVAPDTQSRVGYGEEFEVVFSLNLGTVANSSSVKVTMVSPPFTTHSFSMNQRLLVLSLTAVRNVETVVLGGVKYTATVVSPGSGILAPPGYYILFVVYQDIPSEGVWIQIA